MITKEQIENMKILGMTFLTMAAAQPSGKVDMENPFWHWREYEKSLCNTPACHAGWFAVSRDQENSMDTETLQRYSFSRSADDLAEFLGFHTRAGLENWAGANPDLWGNSFGPQMFQSSMAFTGNKFVFKKNISLSVIGKHWLEVAARCEKESNEL